VDVVLVDVLAFERPEGVEPDVERHAGARDAAVLQCRQQLGREVQAGGRGGGRARRTGVHRLVAVGRNA
jgi:hypothetical protein